MKQPKLTIELVPSTCWYSNLRSELTKSQWDKIRRQSYQAAGYLCEICGGKGKRHPVECHEIWRYDEENLIQKLIGVVSLCPDCHAVKHFGRAQVTGNDARAKKHLCKVNGWSNSDADLYIEHVFEQWSNRSANIWDIDLSYLKKYNIVYD